MSWYMVNILYITKQFYNQLPYSALYKMQNGSIEIKSADISRLSKHFNDKYSKYFPILLFKRDVGKCDTFNFISNFSDIFG